MMIEAWIDVSVPLRTGMVQLNGRWISSLEMLQTSPSSLWEHTKDGVETHHALLEVGIWLIEGLNLSEVAPRIYELICLPLKIEDDDGAPARAILRLVELI